MSDLDFLFGAGGLAGAADKVTQAEPAGSLARALGLTAPADATGAAHAFAVSGDERCWLVLDGTVDVFVHAVLDAHGTAGRRHFVTRIAPGGLLGALPMTALSQGGAGAVAVPSNGARVMEVGLQHLMALAASQDIGTRDALAQAIEGWVSALLDVLAPGPPPTEARSLTPDAAVAVGAGSPVTAARTCLWLPVAETGADWPQAEPGDEAPEPVFRPVTPRAWLVPRADAEIRPLATADWLASGSAAADTTAMETRAAACLTRRVADLPAVEAAAIAQSRRVRRAALDSALKGLAGVIRRRRADDDRQTPPGHPTAAAALLVWQNAGISRHLGSAAEQRIATNDAPIDAIAREAGLFVREVTLEHDWWRGDHGPMLGAYGTDKRPCALLPRGRAGYRLVDPVTGDARPVTAALAAQVDRGAFWFAEPLPDTRLNARALLRFGFSNARGDVAAIGIMAVLTGLISMAVPIITGHVMDPVIPEAQTGQLAVLIAALLVAGGAATAFGLVQSLAMLRLEGRMSNRVQTAVWDRLLRLPASFFRGYSVGDLANRADGIDGMRSLLTGTVTTSLLHAISGLFSLVLMVWYGWRLALVALLFAMLYAVVVYLVGRHILSFLRRIMALNGHIQGVVLQLLGAVGKIRVAGAETSAFARWAALYGELTGRTYDQQRLNAMLMAFRSGFHPITVAAVLTVLALQGHELFALFRTPETWAQIDSDPLRTIMPTAHFVAFNVAFGQFMAAAFGFSQTVVKIAGVAPLYERVRPILESIPEGAEGVEDPGTLAGSIELRDLRFRYGPDAPLVLNGLSLSITPGAFVAIVGSSGAGKSTLVRLLLGFDRPEAGSIFLDGRDLARLNKRLVRRQIGVVLQDGRLLSGSLFHNIAAGANLSRDQVMDAARRAGLEQDIEHMPMGLDTFVGEGGGSLSGGQRQRVMIARAIARRPRILIFDEATSALDNETQAIVSRGLEDAHATRLVIAHRLSTIRHADRIIVLDKGKVVESGDFDTLMATKGAFAALAKRQLA